MGPQRDVENQLVRMYFSSTHALSMVDLQNLVSTVDTRVTGHLYAVAMCARIILMSDIKYSSTIIRCCTRELGRTRL